MTAIHAQPNIAWRVTCHRACLLLRRLPMAQAQHMEPEGKQSFAMTTSLVVKMRANMADAPYTFEKGAVTKWRFSLAYAQLSAFMPLAHQYLAASRLPYAEREEALQASRLYTCLPQEVGVYTSQSSSKLYRSLLGVQDKIVHAH